MLEVVFVQISSDERHSLTKFIRHMLKSEMTTQLRDTLAKSCALL